MMAKSLTTHTGTSISKDTVIEYIYGLNVNRYPGLCFP